MSPSPRLRWRGVCLAAALAALAVAVGPPAAGKQANAKLPPAKDLLDKHLQAVGGKEAILKHKSTQAKAKVEIVGQNITGTLEIFAAAPDKTVSKISIPGVGDFQRGFDGKVAWSITPTDGPALVQGKEAEQMKEDADFYHEADEAKKYKSLETLEETKFENQDCYKVKLVAKTGRVSFNYYDKKSGLLVGSTQTQTIAQGEVTVTSVLSDYKAFGGVLSPTKVVQDMGPIKQLMTLESVEYDKVDPKVFDLPPQIKALVEK
jgi:hypothetical protein